MSFKKIEEVEIASTEVSYDGEILADGTVQVRKCTIEKDASGKVIGRKYHRHVCHPGDDYSNEPQEVKDICQHEHTPEKIQARKDFITAQEAELDGR
jgi:hypothetical protein